jgi:LEA14-like dessication related protein
MRVASVVLPLLLGFVSAGCSNVNLQRPIMSVESMSVQEITPQGFTMLFDVNVANPNSVALPLADVDYKLGLGGVDLLDGTARPGTNRIAANDAGSVTLPVHVTFESLLAAEQAIRRGGGDVPYSLDATFEFPSGSVPLLSQPIRVPLKYIGTLRTRELLKDPTVLLRSPAARKVAEWAVGSIFGR